VRLARTSAGRIDEVAAVALGGMVGALARAGISAALPHSDRAAWPWATFVTNLLGCLLLGVVLDWVDNRHEQWKQVHPRRARLARPLLASGVLGGFTTFSTFSVETYGLLDAGHAGAAVAYAVGSVLLGVAMVVAGRAFGTAAFGAAPLDLREDEVL
jgi:CrcB protein